MGMKVIKKNNFGVYEICRVSFVHTIIYLSIFIVAVIVGYSDIEPKAASSRIMYFLGYSQKVVSIVGMFVIYIMNLITAKKQILIFKKIDAVDVFLKNSQMGTRLEKSNKFLSRMGIFLVGYAFGIYFILVEIIAHIFYLKADNAVHMFIQSFPCAVITTMKIQYYMWTSILKLRFKILNQLLKIHTWKYSKLHTNSFEKCVEDILKVHKALKSMADDVNSMFSFQLVFSFAILFEMVLANGYIVLYTLTIGNYLAKTAYVVYATIKLVAFHTFEIWLLIRSSALLIHEVGNSFVGIFLTVSILLNLTRAVSDHFGFNNR